MTSLKPRFIKLLMINLFIAGVLTLLLGPLSGGDDIDPALRDFILQDHAIRALVNAIIPSLLTPHAFAWWQSSNFWTGALGTLSIVAGVMLKTNGRGAYRITQLTVLAWLVAHIAMVFVVWPKKISDPAIDSDTLTLITTIQNDLFYAMIITAVMVTAACLWVLRRLQRSDIQEWFNQR